MDKNLLLHIQSSNLGAANIRWISDLAMFDFDIKHHCGSENKVADALNHQPHDEIESKKIADEVAYLALLYSHQCSSLAEVLPGMKILWNVKNACEIVWSMDMEKGIDLTEGVHCEQVSVLLEISPEKNGKYQQADKELHLIMDLIKNQKVHKANACCDKKVETERCKGNERAYTPCVYT